MDFGKGDKVYLHVSPTKGVVRFHKGGELSPRFIGSYEILDKVGDLAYRLALPPSLSRVHDVFRVSQLRRYVADPGHVLQDQPEIIMDSDLTYKECPIRIVDQKERVMRNKTIPFVKCGGQIMMQEKLRGNLRMR